MSAINYEVSITPTEPSLQIEISDTSPSNITLKIDKLGDFSMLLEPAGNVGQEILSTLVLPVAQLLALAIPKKVQEGVKGQTFTQDFAKPIGYSFSVEGVDINIKAESLKLSTYNGMLMVTGNVKVS